MEGRLPRLRRLRLYGWTRGQETELIFEDLCPILQAAEQGKLRGLAELRLKFQCWTEKLMAAVVGALEAGWLPSLRHLGLGGVASQGNWDEVARLLGDAMARGVMRHLESLDLQLGDWPQRPHPHIIRGLREGRFDRLIVLGLNGLSRSRDDDDIVAELISAIDRVRFPRLHELYPRYGSMAHQLQEGLRGKEGMRCLHVSLCTLRW
jgi:hypothetical protein